MQGVGHRLAAFCNLFIFGSIGWVCWPDRGAATNWTPSPTGLWDALRGREALRGTGVWLRSFRAL